MVEEDAGGVGSDPVLATDPVVYSTVNSTESDSSPNQVACLSELGQEAHTGGAPRCKEVDEDMTAVKHSREVGRGQGLHRSSLK